MLKISNLNKYFNLNTINEVKVLDNINLNVNKADFITIIGSNGAGKSTLFNCIAGSILADSGSIILDQNDITYKKEYLRSKMIGRLFQNPLQGSAPNMTIEENLALAYLRGDSSRNSFSMITNSDRLFFKEKLKELNLNLDNSLNQKVGTLSGGQRQALSLLMATIVTPKLLLLDEHTAALDPQTAKTVMDLTDDIVSKNKITCLMITHNLNHAIKYGNRILMMEKGRIVLDLDNKENITIDNLLDRFKKETGKLLDNDRILLSSE